MCRTMWWYYVMGKIEEEAASMRSWVAALLILEIFVNTSWDSWNSGRDAMEILVGGSAKRWVLCRTCCLENSH